MKTKDCANSTDVCRVKCPISYIAIQRQRPGFNAREMGLAQPCFADVGNGSGTSGSPVGAMVMAGVTCAPNNRSRLSRPIGGCGIADACNRRVTTSPHLAKARIAGQRNVGRKFLIPPGGEEIDVRCLLPVRSLVGVATLDAHAQTRGGRRPHCVQHLSEFTKSTHCKRSARRARLLFFVGGQNRDDLAGNGL